MKARIVSLTAMLAVCCAALAQVGEYRSDLAFGFNAGVTMNKVSFNPTIKQGYKVGKTFGASLRYTCERYFGMVCALQAEVNYTELGWREVIETSADTYQRTVSYVQVPLLAKLGFGAEDRGAMAYVILGPQVGYCIGDSPRQGGEWSDATLALRPNQVTEQYTLPIENKFEYGLTGGVGVELTAPRAGHFMVEGRYYYALSDLMDNGKADYFSRSANGAIMAKVTYMFDIFKAPR